MFSVVIWLYVCLCHFDSVLSCACTCHYMFWLGDDRYICYMYMSYVLCTCHYMFWHIMLGNFEKPRVPVQKPVVSTTVLVGKWIQQQWPPRCLSLQITILEEVKKIYLAVLNVWMWTLHVCFWLVSLECVNFLCSVLLCYIQLSCYYYSQWWPRTQNLSLSCLASGSNVIMIQMSFGYE